MLEILSLTTTVILVLIGLIHIYWSFGGKFAIDASIPVIEGKPVINPGKILTFFVGLIILGFACVAYGLGFSDSAGGFFTYGGRALSAIFILRAVGEFKTVGFFKKIKSSKFAVNDTRIYSPLSLFIGVSFGIMTAGI